MATVVLMPKLGLTMVQGKVVKWLKRDGESVRTGEPLVVVMRKKITCEVESPASGLLNGTGPGCPGGPSLFSLASWRPWPFWAGSSSHPQGSGPLTGQDRGSLSALRRPWPC